MAKNKNNVADVQGLATKKKREVSIDLMNDLYVVFSKETVKV